MRGPVVMMTVLLLMVSGCSSPLLKGPAPALPNVYDRPLSEYWNALAAYAGIRPEEGLLHDWNLIYTADGAVQLGRLGFVTGPGTHGVTWYTIYQDKQGKTSVSRSSPTANVKDVVHASTFFKELDQVGFRKLEEHSSTSHPAELNLRTIYSSSQSLYKGSGHIVTNGRIVPASENPVTLTGGQGSLYILPTYFSGSLDGRTYIIPSAHRP